MNRLLVCLAVVATLGLVAETASAGHGRRIVRAHYGVRHHHGYHSVYRAPIARYGYGHHAYRHHAYRPAHVYRAPVVAYPVYGQVVYPAYGYAVGHHYGYGPGISVRIGF